MRTEAVYFRSGEFGNFAVHIDGLSTLLRYLETADPKLEQGIKDALRAAAQPVLSKARANASGLSDDGTYSSSLSIASRKGGSQWVLKSDDPTAPVKEFARIGAKTITSKGTKRADARLAKHSGVGVPRRAHAPRAMVPAVNDSADEVKDAIDSELARILEGFHG